MGFIKVLSAYLIAPGLDKKLSSERVSCRFGAGDTVRCVPPTGFCTDASDKVPDVWVVGGQWKPLLRVFPLGAHFTVGGLAIPHGQYERCAN
jgi:hypothetical protein